MLKPVQTRYHNVPKFSDRQVKNGKRVCVGEGWWGGAFIKISMIQNFVETCSFQKFRFGHVSHVKNNYMYA